MKAGKGKEEVDSILNELRLKPGEASLYIFSLDLFNVEDLNILEGGGLSVSETEIDALNGSALENEVLLE